MYFLLYVDNELSAEERHAVEQFVAENNDLAAELELLKQTALPSEEIVFGSKQDLYKKELTPDHLQEKMLSHLDNELEPLLMNLLAAEIAANDDLKREWNILQQTKLDPNEKIIFENKELLYRHEKDRVIPMFFWRAAAAILIIGTALFIGVEKFSGNKNKDAVATSGNNGQQPSKKINQPGTNDAPLKENNVDEQQTNNNLSLAQPGEKENPVKENNNQLQHPEKNIVTISPGEKDNAPDKNNINNITDKRNNSNKSLVQKENNNLPKPYYENINNQDRNKILSSNVQDNIKTLQNKNEDQKTGDKEIAIAKVNEPKALVEDKDIVLTQTNSGNVKNAALVETNSETGNNSILFVSEEKINRSKFGGFFRKVKRVLARNANIKTGNSIKIAGFEIATR
ncbi:MAG: hypothetical protein ABI402_15355 [Ferruginibacter sp.]